MGVERKAPFATTSLEKKGVGVFSRVGLFWEITIQETSVPIVNVIIK